MPAWPGSSGIWLYRSPLLGNRAISTSCAAPGARSHSTPSTALPDAPRHREWTSCARCNRVSTRCAGRNGSPSSWWVMVQSEGPSTAFCSSSEKGRRTMSTISPTRTRSPQHSCSPSATYARLRRPAVISMPWSLGRGLGKSTRWMRASRKISGAVGPGGRPEDDRVSWIRPGAAVLRARAPDGIGGACRHVRGGRWAAGASHVGSQVQRGAKTPPSRPSQ